MRDCDHGDDLRVKNVRTVDLGGVKASLGINTPVLTQGVTSQGVKGRFTSIMVRVRGRIYRRSRRAFEIGSWATNICCMPACMHADPRTPPGTR